MDIHAVRKKAENMRIEPWAMPDVKTYSDYLKYRMERNDIYFQKERLLQLAEDGENVNDWLHAQEIQKVIDGNGDIYFKNE